MNYVRRGHFSRGDTHPPKLLCFALTVFKNGDVFASDCHLYVGLVTIQLLNSKTYFFLL